MSPVRTKDKPPRPTAQSIGYYTWDEPRYEAATRYGQFVVALVIPCADPVNCPEIGGPRERYLPNRVLDLDSCRLLIPCLFSFACTSSWESGKRPQQHQSDERYAQPGWQALLLGSIHAELISDLLSTEPPEDAPFDSASHPPIHDGQRRRRHSPVKPNGRPFRHNAPGTRRR